MTTCDLTLLQNDWCAHCHPPQPPVAPTREPRPRRDPDREYVVSPWWLIADDYDLLRREGYPLDVIASRLGMTRAALDRALCRHKGDPRARRPGSSARGGVAA